jgi:hypothetical protein
MLIARPTKVAIQVEALPEQKLLKPAALPAALNPVELSLIRANAKLGTRSITPRIAIKVRETRDMG